VSNDFMEMTYDKFIFRVESSYLYHPDECWVKRNGDLVTVGVTDFFQKTIGDVIFIELPETGTEVTKGDEAGMIETIKVNVTVISPVSGTIKKVNGGLGDNPQWVNSEPYGEGWLFKMAPSDWETDKKELMEARVYFSLMEKKITKEMAKE
jgi:glycine cleavage system H protein